MKNLIKIILVLVTLALISCAEDSPTNDDNNGNGNGNGDNPLTESGLVYEVDGQQYKIEAAEVQSHNPVRDYLIIVAPSPLGIQLRMIPNEVGTYNHDDGDNEFRRYNVWFPHEGVTYYADNDKGSSTITLTEVGTMTEDAGQSYNGSIKGSFSGVFVSNNGESIVVENGYFYTENKTP